MLPQESGGNALSVRRDRHGEDRRHVHQQHRRVGLCDQRPEDADLKGLQEATSNVYGNGHTLVYADMMDAIAQDRPPYIDARPAAEPWR